MLGLSSFWEVVLAIVLVPMISFEIYHILREITSTLANVIFSTLAKSSAAFARTSQILLDFRSRRYYRPWRSTSTGMTIVTSKKHITELSEASDLSQRAVYADLFGFKYTLNNLDHNEQKAARTRLYGRVLQVNGPSQLSIIQSDLQETLEGTFDQQLKLGRAIEGWTSVRLASALRKTASRMMGVAFFGKERVDNEELSAALLQHPQNMVKSMGAFQITPNFLAPLVHAIVTNRGKAMNTILKHITPIFRTDGVVTRPKNPTIADSMAELNPDPEYWSPEMLAQAITGIWFAASHQPWMNLDFVMLELCKRQDYVQAVRDEIDSAGVLDYAEIEGLPLLDSFIKETIRFNPLDDFAIRRKAMHPFTFSNGGPHVVKGSAACMSFYDATHSEVNYPDATTFNGHRFVGAASSKQTVSRFTDVSEKLPVWGFGSLACPGRFHASFVMKLILVHLITRFDFRLEDENAALQWKWETFTMPYESTRVQFRARMA